MSQITFNKTSLQKSHEFYKEFASKDFLLLTNELYDGNLFLCYVDLKNRLETRIHHETRRSIKEDLHNSFPKFFKNISEDEAFVQAKYAVAHYVLKFDFLNILCLDDLKEKLNITEHNQKETSVKENLVNAIDIYLNNKNS